jgi:hypothetical protein
MENTKSQKERTSQVTSVSVSPLFMKMIDAYGLSPTETFRKGVAVSLCDLGVPQFNTQRNQERSKFVKEFLEKIDADEKEQELFEKIELFQAVKKNFKSIKRIIEEIGE